jgi:hypothetical protein
MESTTDISTERHDAPPGWMTPAASPLAAAMVRRPVIQCANCGHALNDGQRYCLECGAASDSAYSLPGSAPSTVVAPEPTPVQAQVPAPPAPVAPAQGQPAKGGDGGRAFLYGAFGAGLLALLVMAAIALGAYLRQPVQAAAPSVIQAAAGPSTATAAAPETLTSDWPAGTNGWTVVVKEFDKGSATVADVQAFKQEVAGKGLEAGALDSDQFASLTPNQYIVYAGRYEKEKEAQSALKAVQQRGYADASVVEVSSTATETDTGADSKATLGSDDLAKKKNLTPEQQQKESAKLPDETAIEGEPPPKDNKEPGGGTDETEIG